MKRFLSITNLVVWALFGLHTLLVAEELTLPTIRQQGSSLSLSLANEADHATRQAKIWLGNHPPLVTATQSCALVQLALGNLDASTNVMQVVELAGLASRTNQAQSLLEAMRVSYPPRSADPETLWLLSHAINQNHKGLLLRKTEVLDWRNDFAQLLLSAHRKDPAGGSFWDPVCTTNCCPAASTALPRSEVLMAARIRATAFGLLALKEIHE
jgi:hypothetical protein